MSVLKVHRVSVRAPDSRLLLTNPEPVVPPKPEPAPVREVFAGGEWQEPVLHQPFDVAPVLTVGKKPELPPLPKSFGLPSVK